MSSLTNSDGYSVISNAISEIAAEKVRSAFLEADYDLIRQTRHGHFGRMFPDSSTPLPAEDEVYTAEFERSNFLERSELVTSVFKEQLLPKLKTYSSRELMRFDLRAYRMNPGGHFRLHLDDYTAEIGFIWYLSKSWRLDWGGLLLTVNRGLDIRVFLPEFNQVIVLEHLAKHIPHCVTRVESHAKEARMMLVGFLS